MDTQTFMMNHNFFENVVYVRVKVQSQLCAFRAQNLALRTQNSELKTQNSELKMQNSELNICFVLVVVLKWVKVPAV